MVGPWAEALSRFVSRPLRLVRTDDAGEAVDRAAEGAVTLLGVASLERLAQAAGLDGALDGRRFREWLSLLADDVRYRMPVTVTAMRRTDHVPLGAMAHFDEDRYSLEKRVERLEGDHAWTEDPPSRARRFVTNVQVAPIDGGDDVEARSSLLLYRSRGDDRPADVSPNHPGTAPSHAPAWGRGERRCPRSPNRRLRPPRPPRNGCGGCRGRPAP